MKKIIFIFITIILVGGAWYANQKNSGNTSNESTFDKAMKIMENMQSRAIMTEPLSIHDIDTLEAAFIEAQERKPVLQNFRDTDITKLTQKLTTYGVPTNSQANKIDIPELIALIKQKRTEYLGGYTKSSIQYPGIEAALNGLEISNEQKIEIRVLTDAINEKSNDLQLTTTFINNYSEIRPNICTEDGPAFDIYTIGTLSFKYRTGTITDTCVNATKVKESRCIGFIYEDDSSAVLSADKETERNVKTTNCEFGCNTGHCLKGTLGSTLKSYKTATSGTEEVDIDINESFVLRLLPVRANSGISGTLSVEVVSPSLASTPVKCTLSTTTQTLTATTPIAMNFGPIVCSTAGTHVFTINLKEGSTVISSLTKTINIGTVAMKEFNFTHLNGQTISTTEPVSVVKNTPFSLTVQTIGADGLPFQNFTKKFFILVAGDDERTIPEAGQTMNNSDSKILSGLKFSKAGTMTLTVRSEDSLFEKNITIVVTD